MSDLFEIAQSRVSTISRALAKQLVDAPLVRHDLNMAMQSIYGATNASGAWTQRDSFELLEAVVTLHVRDTMRQPTANMATVLDALKLEQSLPTQTVRSEDQIQLQQFSTPIGLAALIVLMGQPTETDIVLEPSAGNGLLVSFLPACKALYLNEIDPQRVARLAMCYPEAHLSSHDGALIQTHHAGIEKPTLILMNPPFSRTVGRGADQNAAARHLHAALRRLAPGGRLVAIMPDWFQPSPSMQQIYETVLKNVTVHSCTRLENAFTKHGTSIATRIYVIDKAPGQITPAVRTYDDTASALSEIQVFPRLTMPTVPPQPLVRTAMAGTTILSSLRSHKADKPTLLRSIAPAHSTIEISYATHQTPTQLGEQVGIYLPYRPSRITIEGVKKHPTDLVESVAMGSIPMPKPSYRPTLPKDLLTDGILSDAQIETLIYAGEAWQRFLPNKMVPTKDGVGLMLDENGHHYRMGYFLGDGTGAGKGRQGAALILDAINKGIKRHIWISKNENLHQDAVRDWVALGGIGGDVQALSQWRIDEPITLAHGILFLTYPTLRSGRQDCTRLKQVLDWAGADFEGVIYMDEAHEMGGVAGGEGARGKKNGSLQGTAGVLLQNNLPLARVAYASATGASTVENLAYAVRLGLWGPGTAFPNRDSFISEIAKGGIASMELVARDLKASGLYAARALSFAGVEYDILKHDLGSSQKTENKAR